VPVFLADVKGDLTGLAEAGGDHPKVRERAVQFGLGDYFYRGYPVTFWDLFGEQGHPVRTTVSEVGPLLLGRMLNLNDIQEAVLTIAFRVADDNGLLLLDIKDLRAMLKSVSDNSKEIGVTYGNIAPASVGAIQRALLALEEQGGDRFFGEPALDLFDFMQTDASGRGMVNILAADRLMTSPRLYSTMLLWLLSELFERLPEAGDLAKPELVFFFDEAHLLFDDAPDALLTKIEQVVRLIRSKGVGVYFVTQNPIDIPDTVLGQCGNKIQHALRAYTPREAKAVKAMAETFRVNPAIDVETVVTELKVGEALVSLLQADGSPMPVERTMMVSPHGRIGAIAPAERAAVIASSLVAGHYEAAVDRESAFELLKARADAALAAEQRAEAAEAAQMQVRVPGRDSTPPKARSSSRKETPLEAFTKSATRAIGSQVGRQIARGILGTILGSRK
jgi:DNA helicase HerA-like ATPase